jgi:deoxyribodipyrimidine photo-lyase
MPSRAIVWFRRDLRVHDNPSLTQAHREFDEIACVFVLDRRLILGEYPSPARTQFLLESLAELRASLRERDGELLVREGRPEEVLAGLAA